MSGRVLSEDENRDLGFGSIVTGESRERLLNRDGTFNVKRKGLGFWESQSLYHTLLTMPWTHFMLLVVASYIAINLLFGTAFLLCGPSALEGTATALPSGVLRSFFFSIETFSTIGYGHIVPSGIPAHVVVTVESFTGMMWLALATGLLFARFSRPTARILFSDQAVLAPYRGITAFEFRIANARSNQLIEVEALVLYAHFEKDGDRRVRRFEALTLERPKVAFFPLAWTVVHPIDEASPLAGRTHQDLLAQDAEFLILLKAHDETFAQTVHARSSYKASEVVWGGKFVTVFAQPGPGEEMTVDLSRLHEIERVKLD